MKPFIRHKKTSMALDIAPLIDVIFMLLLFFMLTTSFIRPSIALKMPEASNKEKIEEQDIIISVDKDDNIYLNRQKVDLNELEKLLKQKLTHSKEKRIIFQGDESILYKKFVNVLDIVKRSGARDINIAHEVKETK